MFRIKKRWSLATTLAIAAVTLSLFYYFIEEELTSEQIPIEETNGLQFQEVSFNALEGFSEDSIVEALVSFRHSCERIVKRSISYYAPAEEWQSVCKQFLSEQFLDDNAFRRFLRNNFRVYKVYYDGSAQGLFTGYYVPRLAASHYKTEEYNVPIYASPNDMVHVDVEEFFPECKKCKIIGRVEDKRLKPYPDRKKIDTEEIDAEVLVWLKDTVDKFILQIQGSGRVYFPDGTERTIGFAGFNGHKFVGIGSLMIKEKLIANGDYSMPSISDWLKKNPQKAQELMWQNPRYIFFRLLDTEAVGGQGVPLTAGRSLAIDTNFINYGVPIWLDTVDADGKALQRLMVAQDTGGAITGAVRGDFFWGAGDKAFHHAGRMKSKGEYYVLLPNNNNFTMKAE